MAIGSPLAPRSPRPRILEPVQNVRCFRLDKVKTLAIGNNRYPCILSTWPPSKNLLNATLVVDRNIKSLCTSPDVRVVEASIT